MANTPQAKKRIRRNNRRAQINHNRIGRIRTFIKKVESAIGAGDKVAAAAALTAVQPEMAKGVAKGRSPQEHRIAQILAPYKGGFCTRLISVSRERKETARRRNPAGSFCATCTDILRFYDSPRTSRDSHWLEFFGHQKSTENHRVKAQSRFCVAILSQPPLLFLFDPLGLELGRSVSQKPSSGQGESAEL